VAAASPMDSPAKWRNSTTRAATGSSTASRVRAASNARSCSSATSGSAGRSGKSTRWRSPPCFCVRLRAGGVDEDAAHGLGGGGEEVPAAVPAEPVGGADQPEVRLVNQGGGLECLVGGLGGHACGGELSQFVVDEREQLRGGVAVAGRRRVEQASHIGHSDECTDSTRQRNGKSASDPPSHHATGRLQISGSSSVATAGELVTSRCANTPLLMQRPVPGADGQPEPAPPESGLSRLAKLTSSFRAPGGSKLPLEGAASVTRRDQPTGPKATART